MMMFIMVANFCGIGPFECQFAGTNLNILGTGSHSDAGVSKNNSYGGGFDLSAWK